MTGATGILGKLFCAGLAEFGAKIAVVDLDETVAVNYAKELQERYDTECMGIACDVSKPKEIKIAKKKLKNKKTKPRRQGNMT